jgi:hypothetical protein
MSATTMVVAEDLREGNTLLLGGHELLVTADPEPWRGERRASGPPSPGSAERMVLVATDKGSFTLASGFLVEVLATADQF